MSDQLTSDELARYHERCRELYGETLRPRGRAVQFDELRFVIDCLSCCGSALRPPRKGVRQRGGSVSCPRCKGTAVEVVGVLAAMNILGSRQIDYLPDWDLERALEAAKKKAVLP